MKNSILFLLLTTVCSSWAQNATEENIVIQKCFDLESVSTYFHGRKPLIILDNGVLSPNLKLTKYNEPVLFLSSLEIREQGLRSFIVFTKFELEKNDAIVSLEYDIEGLIASISFKKINGEWKSVDEDVVEK